MFEPRRWTPSATCVVAATSGTLRLPAAYELREPAHPLANVGEAAVDQRAGDLVVLEHPHAAARSDQAVEGPQRRGPRAAGREDRDAAARGEDARHVIERHERLGEQVERGEAAHGVEAAVPEREL